MQHLLMFFFFLLKIKHQICRSFALIGKARKCHICPKFAVVSKRMDKMLIFNVFAGLQMCCQNQNFVNTLPCVAKWVKTATFDDIYEGIKQGSTMIFADCLL